MKKISKGRKEYCEDQLKGLKSILDRLLESDGDSFNPDTLTNLKKISYELEESANNLYLKDDVNKYFSTERPPMDMPINTLTVVRFSGNPENISRLNVESFYRNNEEKKNYFISQNLNFIRVCRRTPKFIGYSDSVMFHIIYYTFLYLSDPDFEEAREALENHLIEIGNKYWVDIIENRLVFFREAGAIPIYRLDSWCPKHSLDKNLLPYYSAASKICLRN